MADQQKPWNGNNVFRAEGYQFVPSGSTAAKLLAGAYGPDPNQTAPQGFGGLVANPDGTFATYGTGSHLAGLLAGVNQATGGKLGPVPPGTPGPQIGAAQQQKAAPSKGPLVNWVEGMGRYFSPFYAKPGQSVMDAYMERLAGMNER